MPTQPMVRTVDRRRWWWSMSRQRSPSSSLRRMQVFAASQKPGVVAVLYLAVQEGAQFAG